ncbi:hypothetical protein [Nonomuraea recticatena]|uniref:Uncharacterized protein n=1 Tax=Nonomuraea recticatena TaxID=46178 RepID=A0ABP6DYZ5_9ACTN
MRVYGLWFGGASYTNPDDSDLEEFASITDAREKLLDRYWRGCWQRSRFNFVARTPTDTLTPGVALSSEILLYRSRDSLDCPGWRLSFGPRGGARLERL